MKLHDLDWQEVLAALPRWEALSPGARRAFLTITPGQGFDLASLGAAGAELRDAGLLIAPTGRGSLHGLDPALRPLLVALRAADRLRPLHGPGGVLRQEYVADQFDVLQSHRIAIPGRSYYTAADRKQAADTVSSTAWVRAFLAAGSQTKLATWEDKLKSGREKPRLVFTGVAAALRALVQALSVHPHGVPLRSLATLVPDAKPANVAAALAAGLRYLLVFVSIGRDTEAVVGLLPAVAARMSGTVPPPQPVQVRETFAAPFRVGDMTALLVEAATEPIAIRASDHSLYVRAQRAIAARLAAIPEWVQHFAATGALAVGDEDEDEYDGEADPGNEEAAARVELAVQFASLLKLAAVKSAGDRMRLEATRTGRAWLARGEGERLKEMLSAVRGLPQRNPTEYGSSGGLDFFGAALGFQVEARGLDARASITDAFLSVPPGALVPFLEFARYHARENNPYVGPDGPRVRARSYWSSEPRTIEGWEDVWANLLLTFLARRLVPLGCATLGRMEDGGVAFGLTDAGRYLLGAADDFELPPEAGGGEVVVQPDFEIVFLAPAPRAEAELGRIAERTGSGVGALLRLTRASVLRAAEQGMTTAQLLKTLEAVARGGVPANVERQLKDWMKAVRTIRIAPAVLIDCPDAETAGRVRALGGAHVTSVTATLLRLDADAKTRAALIKRLREKGIFVGTGGDETAAAAPATKRGRGRR
ncbi:helicase-associated domain-containing protein [Longimicrobium sp.]|uniref:helicase-associated domain-containing protein n=1 Tax=Longimicrobium sp. TaxID=2029185 RepID=UPI003B3B704D